MKILSLKALNINSLRGHTEIDFASLTQNNALFAITGPTGSGKSTILDIISCALYGRTARLKNPNDLMSRHRGEAFCEVEFEVKGKHYRSSWTQKRARKKHDGAFQTAKMELVDLDKNEILSQKSREVPKKVEELSGLDFGRFTQSMLLAQGGFDAFLKADEKERSALLEKITGTQVYADISKTVFEKYREYQQEIQAQEKVLNSIELLEPDVVKEKEKKLSENVEEKTNIDSELKKLTLELNWLEKLSELQEESIKYEEAFLKSSKQKEEYKSSFEKLHLANKALSVVPTYLSYNQLFKNLLNEKETLIKLDEDIKSLEKDIKEKKLAYGVVQKEFEHEYSKFALENEKLKKAREIQTQEKELQLHEEKKKTLLSTQKEELVEIKNRLENIVSRHQDISQKVKSNKDYISLHKEDEKLLATLGMLEQNIVEYKKEVKEILTLQNRLELLQHKIESENLSYTLKKESSQMLSRRYKESELSYKILENETLNSAEKDIKKRLEDIQILKRAVESYLQVRQLKKQELQEGEKYEEKLNSLQQTYEIALNYFNDTKTYIETLRQKQAREQLLKKYEEERKTLVDGEACMLCGSTEHPFASALGEVYVDKTKEMIATKLEELEEQEKDIKKLEQDINVTKTKQESSKDEVLKLKKESVVFEKVFGEYAFVFTQSSAKELEEKEQFYTKELFSIEQNRVEKELRLKQRDEDYKAFQKEEKLLYELETSLQTLKIQNEQITSDLELHTTKKDEYFKKFTKDFELFGVTFELEKMQTQYDELQSRKNLFISMQASLKELEVEFNNSNIEKKESESKVTFITQSIEKEENDLKELVQKLKELSFSRINILNVAHLDSYEKEINLNYTKVQEKEQNFKTLLNELVVKMQERVTQKNTLDEKIVEDEKNLHAINLELEKLYKQNGFKDTQEFQNAMMQEEQRQELMTLCNGIENSYNQTKALYTQTAQKLQIHKEQTLSNKETNELKVALTLLKEKVDTLQETIGSDKKELELNQINSEKHKEKIALLEKEKESFKVWVKLNELIGSADGTKFKKFAQGITLDQLINLANQHLELLSSRYTLSRNQEKLLELEIIDAYQANVVRPVATLSGGESFIVSLALALGLSELASQKISIDSLFLDEGFGTLDEESLETALNALNLLQSGGKMVGVISHVEALKERIPLQIKVIPRGDGSSVVEI